jgi:chromosome segregation ATPase
MTTPNLPQGQSPGRSDDAGLPDRSRIEETLVKSSIWKKQTMRDIEYNRALAANETNDRDSQRLRLIQRLSAQLDERNDEIERLRKTLSKLKNEKSKLGLAHKRQVALSQAELKRLQDAYDQFEKESDSLLSELTQQNERLLEECRHQNVRSLLEQ